ncbi:cytochrome P450 9e2-like [Athalia rosae]|uniref:cytochrome P450 9e2-like n=1 Tax=Athalia rosae TaxID=37344 RepID=UPI0020346EE2|nr:cytochrome P450 9e2-like [Athalia rosae]
MDIWTIPLTLIAGVVVIYLFFKRKYSYFEKHGIPYERPLPLFGNMMKLFLKIEALPYVVDKVYKRFPDTKYFGFYDFTTSAVVIKDLELIKEVTIKNFNSFPNHRMVLTSPTEPLFQQNLVALKDDEWRDMRTLLSPAFTSSKMKMMFNIVTQCAINFSNYLASQDPQPEALEMKDTFGRCTLDMIASTAFGLSTDSMKDRDNQFFKLGKKVADISGFRIIKFFILRSIPAWLARLFNIRFLDVKTSNYFTNIIKSTIETRDRENIVRPDMIHLMMQGRDRKDKSTLSMENMAAQAFIFLVGGYEGPSSTMCYAAQLVASDPDVKKKLQAEIDEVLKDKKPEEVTYEEIMTLKYLDAVVNETLRMFTPGFLLDRIGPTGFTLPPALPGLEPLEMKPFQNVWIPVYSLHHDPKYYPNPHKFDPERFSDENKGNINPLTYMPFGIGPRICIANRYALMIVKLAIFHLFAKCDVLTCSKTSKNLKFSATSFSPRPDGGFWLKIRARE